MYLSEVDNSIYGKRNTSMTESTNGKNKDMPLVLNSNQAIGVTNEVSINKDKRTHIL